MIFKEIFVFVVWTTLDCLVIMLYFLAEVFIGWNMISRKIYVFVALTLTPSNLPVFLYRIMEAENIAIIDYLYPLYSLLSPHSFGVKIQIKRPKT